MFTKNGNILKINGNWLCPQGELPGPFDTVTIGTQQWMKYNLAVDYQDMWSSALVIDNLTVNGYNFGKQYLYTYSQAVNVANTIEGFHLPTYQEWQTLATYVHSNYTYLTGLGSVHGWNNGYNGTDLYGLNLMPIGAYYSKFGVPSPWYNQGTSSYIWTTTETKVVNLYQYVGTDLLDQTYYWIDYNFKTPKEITNTTSGLTQPTIYLPIRLIKDS